MAESLKMVFKFICERKKGCFIPLLTVLIELNELQV